MAATSDPVIATGPDGLPVEVSADGDIYGRGTLSARPTAGSAAGDRYWVEDPSNQVYRLDIWDGVRWIVNLELSASDPGNSDDVSSGYVRDTRWVNTSTNEAFVCLTNASGAAVWKSMTAGASSGVTETQHEDLDTLVHDLAESAYAEVTRSAGRVVDVITWQTAAKLKKVREVNVTRTSGQISQIVKKHYDSSGALLAGQTLTGTVVRSGGRVSSIEWVQS